MSAATEQTTILVTGGSGYIASWIIKYLLEDGYRVHATVRDPDDGHKTGHLRQLMQAHEGRLTLFKADLLSPAAFDEAMQGCQIVLHTASPFFIDKIKDAQRQLIQPALNGTRNVLESVDRVDSVRRVVLTSSVAAVYGDAADMAQKKPGEKFTERDWNTTSSASHQPYSYSKTVAEKLAWQMAEAQQRWDLVVINPGFVMGPSLSSRKDSTSIDFMCSFFDGRFKRGVPKLYFGIVDVRDVARAHIAAATRPTASGRHILVAETVEMLQMAQLLAPTYGAHYPLPHSRAPKFLLYLIGPFLGYTWKYVANNVGTAIDFDDTRSREDLQLTYHPLQETLLDHAQQLIASGLIPNKAQTKA